MNRATATRPRSPGARRPSVAALLVVALACTGSPRATRSEVAAALATSVQEPLHREATSALRGLESALEGWCGDGSTAADAVGATPETVHAAYAAARRSWSRAAVVPFGPAKLRRSASRVDWRPVDPERIASELTEGEPFTEERARQRFAANQRGLPAISILLASPDAAEDPARHRRRCDYLVAVAAVAAAEAQAVTDEWAASHGRDRGAADPTAVDELVRGVVFALEDLVDRELRDRPAGSQPVAPAVDSLDVLGRVEGIGALYDGSFTPTLAAAAHGEGSGLGLSDLVAQLSRDTDERVRSSLAAAIEAATAAASPESAASQAATRAALASLQRIWSTEVVSLLGVTVGFSDNDGDTG